MRLFAARLLQLVGILLAPSALVWGLAYGGSMDQELTLLLLAIVAFLAGRWLEGRGLF